MRKEGVQGNRSVVFVSTPEGSRHFQGEGARMMGAGLEDDAEASVGPLNMPGEAGGRCGHHCRDS